MAEVIQSYLISLGLDLPSGELPKLGKFLGEAEHLIDGSTTKIVKDLLLWQAGITSAFAAVTGATVGLVEHAATADQQFRIMGERMLIGTDQARSLSLALKAVGLSLEDAMWDPQARHQLEESLELQKQLAVGLGADYEKNMQQLQEILFHVRSIGTEFTYLTYYIANDIFKAFGTSPDLLLAKLKDFEQWFVNKGPGVADFIAEHLVPVLTDFKMIAGDTAGLLEDLGLAFTNLVGVLSGDRALEGTTFSAEKLADAVGKVSHFLAESVDAAVLAERAIVHFGEAAIFTLQGVYDAAHFRGAEAKKDFALAGSEMRAGTADINSGSGAVLGFVGGSATGAVEGGLIGSAFGPLGTIAGVGIGSALEGLIGAVGGQAIGSLVNGPGEHGFQAGDAGHVGGAQNPAIQQIIAAAAQKYDIPANLLTAQAGAESGGRTYKDGVLQESGKGPNGGAKGLFQFEDATAKQYGVDVRDPASSAEGAAHYMSDLLTRYHGDLNAALGAYNFGPAAYDRAMREGRHLPTETTTYQQKIEASLHTSPDQHPQIHLETHVNVARTNASPQEIADAAQQGALQGMQRASLYPLVAQQGVFR